MMRDTIYTIPINDVFEPKTGCPICLMYNMLEERSIEYIMGAAMMEPDIRIETNKVGFCECHYTKMRKIQNRLSLALILETHLDEIMEKTIGNVKKKDYVYTKDKCFVCNRIDDSMNRMIETIVKLYVTDESFKENFNSQPFYCLTHYEMMCQTAQSKLNKKNAKIFCEDLTTNTTKYLEKLRENVHSFATMFDYRNNEASDEVKTSIDMALKFLTSHEIQK